MTAARARRRARGRRRQRERVRGAAHFRCEPRSEEGAVAAGQSRGCANTSRPTRRPENSSSTWSSPPPTENSRAMRSPSCRTSNIYRSGEEEQSALKRMWEGFLDFAANVLENPDADQVAARIPFTGHHQGSGDESVRDHCERVAQCVHQRVRALARGLDHVARREEEPARRGPEQTVRREARR